LGNDIFEKNMIPIKNKSEIEAMRKGGKILAEIMDRLEKKIAPGKNTSELDKLAEELVFANGGTPAFKGYGGEVQKPFPATICTSLNDEVVHGIPSEERFLCEGDIIKIDIGMKYDGMFTDMARSFPVGKISREAQDLIDVTEQCFRQGVKKMKAGNFLSDYSKAAQKNAEQNGFSVVRNLVGHGIGKELHEDPYIPNYYNKKYQDYRLAAGITLALEPMINAGGFETVLGKDGWTFRTKDGKLNAHYENTVLITEKGTEILTEV
jgi:methionyl aminopeptidase